MSSVTGARPASAAGPPPQRARARDLGIRIGLFEPGATNSLVDVPGVRVGHATVWRDEPSAPEGRGIARSGVTAIVPAPLGDLLETPMAAGASVLNGAGELTGFNQIEEWGVIETPVFLTSTMAVGRVYDAAIEVMLEVGQGTSVEALIPIVTECDDSTLNDTRVVQVDRETVREALATASGSGSGAVAQGVVGAGTGMVCHELKGGIGSASRRVRAVHRFDSAPGADAPEYTLGALALTNYGLLERLTLDGVPVGRWLREEGFETEPRRRSRDPEGGSCIVVLVTDAPLDHSQLTRLARRAGLGLARTGSYGSHGSGEIFVALSTSSRPSRRREAVATRRVLSDDYIGTLFAAAVEATEEAAIDSLFAADTVAGRDGTTVAALPLDRMTEYLRRAGRAVDRAGGAA
jgi:D-aminopeptidase